MPLVVNLDGCVLLPPSVCRVFAPILRRAIDEATRRDGARYGNEIWDELGAIEAAARAAKTHDIATTMAQSAPSGSVDVMTVTEAARLRGTSRQAVLAQIGRKTLPARRDERGRWLIRRENVEVA